MVRDSLFMYSVSSRNLNFIISDYLCMVCMMCKDKKRLNGMKRTKDKVYQTLQKEQISLRAVWNKHFGWNFKELIFQLQRLCF